MADYWHRFTGRPAFRCEAITLAGARCKRPARWGLRPNPYATSERVLCGPHAKKEGASV